MAVDRIADFVLSNIDARFPTVDVNSSSVARGGDNLALDTLLERNLSDDIIEIPAFCFSDSIFRLEIDMREENSKDIISVINGDLFSTERKQVNTILKDFTLRRTARLSKIKNKENIYYGCPGVITDINFNTILCMKIRIEKHKEYVAITDYLCYVSPKVFSNQDGILEKTSYKKIIPFCSSYVLHNDSQLLKFYGNDFVKYDWDNKHISVIIKDNEECFKKPVTPKIKDFESDELLKNILLDNIDSMPL